LPGLVEPVIAKTGRTSQDLKALLSVGSGQRLLDGEHVTSSQSAVAKPRGVSLHWTVCGSDGEA
jgi:hypothetical protein